MLDIHSQSLQLAEDNLAQHLENIYTTIQTFIVDISNEATVKKFFAEIMVEQKRIPALVNNAGYQSLPQHFRDADVTEWWRGFEVNVKGTFTVSQRFVRL